MMVIQKRSLNLGCRRGLVCVVVVAICIVTELVTASNRFPMESYLDLPKPEEFDEVFHWHIRQAIQRLPIEQGASAKSILGLMQKEAEAESGFEPIYQVLINITPQNGGFSCNDNERDVIASLLAQMRHDPLGELNRKLAPFMNHDVKHAFAQCVAAFERDHYKFVDVCNIDKLDELFRETLDRVSRVWARKLNPVQRDYEIGSALREFDPTKDKLNERKLIKLLRRKSRSGNIVPDLSFDEFVERECRGFQTCYARDVQVLNLASLLGNEPSSFGPAVKLNEYARLCRAWWKPSKKHTPRWYLA